MFNKTQNAGWHETIQNEIRNFVWIIAGVSSAVIGLKAFLIPNHFIDGGITGIALIINAKLGLPVSASIVLLNIPFVFLGIKQIGLKFVLKTLIAICLLALGVAFVHLQPITDENVLITIFGGFFLGAGIGMCVRGGCVIDGTEILSLWINRKTGQSVGDIIMAINVVIFLFAAVLINTHIALYGMVTFFFASRTVDFIVQGIDEYSGVTIITEKSEQIRQMIIYEMGRGVTLYKGQRGYGKRGENYNQIDIVFTVVSRLEIGKLKDLVKQIDETAFVVIQPVSDTKGGTIRKGLIK